MDGTPYWGKDTFSQIRDLGIRKPTKVKPQHFKATDMYSLFHHLATEGYLFILEEKFCSWCWDIRFNYRDREIFIPYYAYEQFFRDTRKPDLENPYLDILDRTEDKSYIGVRYKFEMRTRTLDDRRINFRTKFVSVYHPQKDEYFLIDISELPYLTKAIFSMEDLLQRHTNMKYIIPEFDSNSRWESYLKINRRKHNREKALRKQHNLPVYSDLYTNIDYQDIRMFPTHTFSEEYQQVTSQDDFKIRMYEFEAFLYCIFASNANPIEDEYLQLFNSLGVKNRFISIGSPNPHPLILKYYYTDKQTKFKKLSYERYKEWTQS